MKYIPRAVEAHLQATLKRGKSVLLLGPRQTGKTTLFKHFKIGDLLYTLLDSNIRLRFEKNPSTLMDEINAYKRLHHLKHLPLVIIDEVQKVPELMDAVQLMIDNHEAQFILSGSSVRKLRRHPHFNLLPGRVINIHLAPLSLLELPPPLPDIETLLLYGSLPGIYLENDDSIKQSELESYVTNYLEEEVRGEAQIRQLGTFVKFLEFAAVEAGHQINLNKLSQELGVGRHTIAEYYQLLEDCLIVERIDPITQVSTRRRLTKAAKYLFFDMGIRRIAAGEGARLSLKTMGELFEQFIGVELLRAISINIPMAKLRYWRDHAGPEIDYVVEHEKRFVPIEVKWTETPTVADAKHMIKFLDEYECYKTAYIICRCKKPLLLHENILALPWQELDQLFNEMVSE